MPFQSKAQMRAAFSGALGPEMKKKAKEWAKETPNIKALPEKKKRRYSNITDRERSMTKVKQGG